MRTPNDVLKTQRWIIDDIVHDFDVEDVWALPIDGGPYDFGAVIDLMQSIDFPGSAPLPVRLLWGIRDLLGRMFGLGRISTSADDAGAWPPVPGTDERSLIGRVPAKLRNTATDSHLTDKPFRPLYLTDTEFADEISNRTMYGVMHLAWVDQGGGRYQAQMTVYVKPARRRRQGVPGFHQAVSLRDHLSGARAIPRTILGRTTQRTLALIFLSPACWCGCPAFPIHVRPDRFHSRYRVDVVAGYRS